MAKEVLTLKRRVGPKARKKRSPGTVSRDELIEAPTHPLTGISNRGMQRLLEINPKSIMRNLPPGANDALSKVMREVEEEEAEGQNTGRRGRANNGAITIAQPNYDFYDVTGQTLEEVGSQLDPEEWGSCEIHYGYSYETTEGKTTRVNLTITRTIRLPRWRGEGYRLASRAARQEWERMLRALRRHEERHDEIGRSWGPKIREGLLNLDEAVIEQTMSQLEADAQKKQDEYDENTNHGQNEGVTLDLSIE